MTDRFTYEIRAFRFDPLNGDDPPLSLAILLRQLALAGYDVQSIVRIAPDGTRLLLACPTAPSQ